MSCSVCNSGNPNEPRVLYPMPYNCIRCGYLMIDNEAKNIFYEQAQNSKNAWKIDAISHLIRRQSDENFGKAVFVNEENAKRWVNDPAVSIQSPATQAHNLLIWLGNRIKTNSDPAEYSDVGYDALASILGSRNITSSARYVTNSLFVEGLIELDQSKQKLLSCRLTFKGWERFDELQRSPHLSRIAFMAMQFHDDKLDNIFENCWTPAVNEAGFELHRLIDKQGAGLIDDQLRVRIRTAKFLIADLTSANKGAYWEAGFAEGLGRPIIYVCEKTIWDSTDKNIKPHFDTSHMNTVIWEHDKLGDARTRLANMIRNTFPAEAKFES